MNDKKKNIITTEAEKRKLGPANLSDDMFNTNTVISSTECTGLTPSNVDNEDQALSYTEIYNVNLTPYEMNKNQVVKHNKSKKGEDK